MRIEFDNYNYSTLKSPLPINYTNLAFNIPYQISDSRVIIAVYCRLSREEIGGRSESISIENQRQLILSYIKEKGWDIFDIYVDDGYTGTTFDRPAFKRMISDIEAGKINCVITKDLSRLGRNYAKVGYYTDEYFPEHRVRLLQ